MKVVDYFMCLAASCAIGYPSTVTSNGTNISQNGTDTRPVPPGIPLRCRAVNSMHECLLLFPKYNAANDAFIYGLPLVIMVGTIGNVLSLIVFSRWQMRQTATYFYMAVLAVADLLVLYISAFRLWITKLSGFDVMATTNAACKTFSFLPQWCTHFSAWILVAMTVDRFIAVNMPLKAIVYSTLPKARITVIVIAIILILFDMQVLWKLELTERGCVPNDDDWYEMFPWLDMALYSFVPFLVLAIFNTIIAKDMIHARATQQALQGKKNDQHIHSFGSKVNIQVTSMLLFVTTAFLCFTLPICILFIIRTVEFSTHSIEGAIDYIVMDAATRLLMYLNHSCNFFLYCLVGRKFRMSLAAMCCSKKRRQTSVMGSAMTQSSRMRFSSSSSQRYSVNA
ncbi:probable G-protein coupled receptor 139 [Lineus longissimus]|uniref:probable G-protein coupled receptor 139 n=1 Tax=Lineus longissimus TaxID=88925 RepID=UPI00315D0143